MPKPTGVGRLSGENECRSPADSYSIYVFSFTSHDTLRVGHLLGACLCLRLLWRSSNSGISVRLSYDFNRVNARPSGNRRSLCRWVG